MLLRASRKHQLSTSESFAGVIRLPAAQATSGVAINEDISDNHVMAIETQFSVRALLEQHFGGPIKIAPELTPELIKSVIAASGVGLDHTIGESVLAVGDNSKARELEDFFMLTDRRIAGRHWRVFFHVALDEITKSSIS